MKFKIANALIVFCLCGCATSEKLSRHAGSVQSKAAVSELPIDSRLASALGVTMRTLEVTYPSSMKLSVTQRVYRDGVFDSTMSSRQVHGTTMPIGNQFLDLGCFDPETINSEPQSKMKIFGTPGVIWIEKPSMSRFGLSIDVPKTGELLIGKEELAMELVCGVGHPHFSQGVETVERISKIPAIRVTLHVLVEPLSIKEQKTLSKQSNFNKAFKVDE